MIPEYAVTVEEAFEELSVAARTEAPPPCDREVVVLETAAAIVTWAQVNAMRLGTCEAFLFNENGRQVLAVAV